jgi:nickel-dependent lactate racemase
MITVGTVRHHYFAGFGGGPKMVFPGIAGHEEIQANHAQVLEREGRTVRRRPECEPGVLEGNPVAEEIARAVDLHPPGFSLCLVPGRDGGIARATAGPWRPAFEAAVELVRGWYEVAGGAFDHLVGCAGGPPGDSTLIQAHKALDAICRFANPGAEVMFVADLGGGAGSPAMDPFLEDPRAEAVLRRLADHYVQYGHTTLRIVEKTANHRIYLRSRLDPGVARRLGFIPVDDLDEIAERWRGRGVRDRVAVMSETPVWPKRQQPSTSS